MAHESMRWLRCRGFCTGPACGVAADFVVFVTARQTEDCRPTTTAHAVVCILDTPQGLFGPPRRPLAGHVNFCPSAGSGGMAAAPRSVEAVVDTAVHELLHTLYMSRGLYREYQRTSACASPSLGCARDPGDRCYGGDLVIASPKTRPEQPESLRFP